jgi:sulfatase maturation enzyme AslB (radical SAM superfamily)
MDKLGIKRDYTFDRDFHIVKNKKKTWIINSLNLNIEQIDINKLKNAIDNCPYVDEKIESFLAQDGTKAICKSCENCNNDYYKITLNIIHRCNLHCKYCFCEGGRLYKGDVIDMDESTAKKGNRVFNS